jgi:hypothetical protein
LGLCTAVALSGCGSRAAPRPVTQHTPGACGLGLVDLAFPPGSSAFSYEGSTVGAPAEHDPDDPDCASDTGPEVAHRLTVPGAGPVRLLVSTDSPATQIDTVLYVDTACSGGRELGCNDDKPRALGGRSELSVDVAGGDTVVVWVDSYSGEMSLPGGTYELRLVVRPLRAAGEVCDLTGARDACPTDTVCTGTPSVCQAGQAPVLDTAELLLRGGGMPRGVFLFVSGHDADADVTRLQLIFRAADGTALEQAGGSLDLLGNSSFVAAPVRFTLPNLPRGIAAVEVALVDSVGHVSATQTVVARPMRAIGDSCDVALTAPDECAQELACAAGTCAVAAITEAACMGAQALDLAGAITITGTLGSADRFEGSCVFLPGAGEQVYALALPDADHTWTLHAEAAPTGQELVLRPPDVYLFLRADCATPASEVACNADAQPVLDAHGLMAGRTVYLFVDGAQPGEAGDFRIQVGLQASP